MFNIRRRLLIAACTAGILGGGVALSPAINVLAAGEAEPNDSEKSATKISVNEDVTGNFKDQEDSDWYQFTVDKDGKFNLSFSHEYVDSGNNYWRIRVYDSELVPLHDGGIDFAGNFRDAIDTQDWGIEAGTYYIEVSRIYFFSDATYTLKVNYEESDAWEHESNDSMNSAQSISVNKNISGALNKSGDKDWYQFTLSEAGVVSYSFKHDYKDSGNEYWRAALYDADGAKLNELVGYRANDRSTVTSCHVGLPAGTYYFEVDTSYWWSAEHNYTFNIVFENEELWETEDNSSLDLADEIKPNETIKGSRPTNDDVDYYQIVIPSNAKAAIRFGHKRIDDDNKLWRVTLLENSGEEVGKYESKGTSNGVITLGEEELAAGTYYVKVDTSWWNNNSDYSLEIQVDDSIPDGLNKAADGNIYYYKDGKVDKTFVGYADYDGAKFHVKNGTINTALNGVMIDGNADPLVWYFCANGQVQTQHKGLAEYDGEWFYVDNGKVAVDMNAFVKYDGGLFAVAAGRIVSEYSGLMQDPQNTKTGDWYFFANGQAQTQYTGLALYDGHWFYVQSGKFDPAYNGTVIYDGAEFTVVNGEAQIH